MRDLLYTLIITHGTTWATWALTALAALIARYVLARVASERVRGILERAMAEVRAVVLEVWQTYVESLKAASSDGALTQDERIEAKRRAMTALRANLGSEGLERLARVLGVDSVDGWLSGRIETAIGEAKLVGKAAGASSSPRAPAPLQPVPSSPR